MSKDKSISIRMNGKKTFSSSRDKKEDLEQKEWKSGFKEQAATMASSFDPDDLMEFEKTYDLESEEWRPPHKSKKKPGIPPVFKIFALAAGAAVLVGVTLGFIMLKMFAGIEEGTQEKATTTTTQTTSDTSDQGVSSGEGSSATGEYTTDPLAATVVQAGVFSSNDNASKRTSKIESSGYAAMVWQQGEQFYVLTGLASSETAANTLSQSLTSNGVESIVKPWETTSATASLSEKGTEWVQQFPQLWKDSLALVGSGEESKIQNSWKEWIGAFPEGAGEKAKALFTAAQGVAEGGEQNRSNQIQIDMLKALYQYQQLSK
ncbi:hypothetical protein KO561_11965 [Radiobacillus kanasensis]|uniref:SPOR domain-containing protein n=1 Tax=Radiobacillus kanasensis TaxID=2844358 RepID=UPI001E4CD817|nr:SPOR domain-containing protein [Radiobacillus kanasensis]UFT97924.1 hypothetical protein KO561_11965 [Radiobacillus kanasensis]